MVAVRRHLEGSTWADSGFRLKMMKLVRVGLGLGPAKSGPVRAGP